MRRRVEITIEIDAGREDELADHLDALQFFVEEMSERFAKATARVITPRPRSRPRAPAPVEIYLERSRGFRSSAPDLARAIPAEFE